MAAKLINCKACGHEIAKSAKTCPNCGAKNKAKPNVLCPILGAVAVIFVIGLLSGGPDDDSNVDAPPETRAEASATAVSTTKAETTQKAIEYIEITATELLEAYDANEVAADNQYKNKMLKITGTVGNIGKDILDSAYITLTNDEEQYTIVSVQCYFAKNNLDDIATLKEGDIVTLTGKCGGSSMNVLVRDCDIIKQ